MVGNTNSNFRIGVIIMEPPKMKLTAPELSNLWAHYIRETLSVCVCKYVLVHIQDGDIRSIFEEALSLSQQHIQKLTEFFNLESFPIPQGFTDEDVDVNAPALFSDFLWLEYLHDMVTHGLSGFSIAFSTSIHPDIRGFYYQCNTETMSLYNRSIDLLNAKGIYHRPPSISIPEKVDFVTDKSFTAGWFVPTRPLNILEMNNVYFNLKKSILAKVIFIGFSQVAKLKEVRQFMTKATYTAQKHIEIFSTIMHDDHISTPPLWDSDVTNTTTSPFSDKLLMFHAGYMFSVAIAYYGAALATSMRKDLAKECEASIIRDLKIADNWSEIMIKHGWLEQPPLAQDRRALSRI